MPATGKTTVEAVRGGTSWNDGERRPPALSLVAAKPGALEVERRPLGAEPLTIGRRRGADLKIEDPTVSGTHASITLEGARYAIRDLASRNGTFLNGERVFDWAHIEAGDVIRVGRSLIVVEDAQPPVEVGEATLSDRATVELPVPLVEGAPDEDATGVATAGAPAGATHMELLLDLCYRLGGAACADTVCLALRDVAARGFAPAAAFVVPPAQAGAGIAAEVVRTGRPALSPRAIGAPVLCGDEIKAVVYVQHPDVSPAFEREDLAFLAAAANRAGAALDNLKLRTLLVA